MFLQTYLQMMGREVCRRYIVRDVSFLLHGQVLQYELLRNLFNLLAPELFFFNFRTLYIKCE